MRAAAVQAAVHAAMPRGLTGTTLLLRLYSPVSKKRAKQSTVASNRKGNVVNDQPLTADCFRVRV